MDYGGITIATIKGTCSEASFDRGRRYYLQGMVRSARMRRGVIEAAVTGTSRYAVRVTGGSGSLECRCTCPYDYGGYCKHIVSVLLHVRDNARSMREDEAGRRKDIADVLGAATGDQIREFLAEEMEDSGELLDRFVAVFGTRQGRRADYRAMAESMYDESADGYHDPVPYGTRIDFDKITRLARSHKDRKDYEEAIRAYRELSEVIAKNMDMVDDSDGYYGTCFSDAIRGMAECINGQGVAKERHITYVFERFMLGEPDYLTDDYEDALDAICTGADDLAHWGRLLDPHVPDTIPSDEKGWSEHYGAVRLIMMKIDILERTGSGMLTDILAKHYRDDHDICIEYITHMEKRDRQAALRIAEEGARMFPRNEEIRVILHGMHKKTDPGSAESLQRIFLRDGSWKHYDELKRTSRRWDGELESIIGELGRRGNRQLLIRVFLREQMTDRAMRLILQCDSLRVLEEHHGKVCALYPGEYHAAYGRHIDRIAKSARGRDGYRRVKEHLKMMKAVPGHTKEFGEFVGRLRKRHARQPAFLDEIKRF